MAYELFISPNRLKRDTALGGSVDDDLIAPYIWAAQMQHIYPVLGTALYDKMTADVGTGSVTGEYETLLETYIQPCLVQFAFATLIPFLRVRFVNNAIVVMESEQSSPADSEQIKSVVNKTEALASFLKERLIDRLIYNTELYPEYRQNTGEQLHPSIRCRY